MIKRSIVILCLVLFLDVTSMRVGPNPKKKVGAEFDSNDLRDKLATRSTGDNVNGDASNGGKIATTKDLKSWNFVTDFNALFNKVKEKVDANQNIVFWSGWSNANDAGTFIKTTRSLNASPIKDLLSPVGGINWLSSATSSNYPYFWSITSFLYGSSIAKLIKDHQVKTTTKYYLAIGPNFAGATSSVWRYELETLKLFGVNVEIDIRCSSGPSKDKSEMLNDMNPEDIKTHCN